MPSRWSALLLCVALASTACTAPVDPGAPGSPTVITTATTTPTRTPRATPTRAVPKSPPTATARRARRLLAHLKFAPRPTPAADYNRDAFGPRWSDIDGNGCNQRDDVLLRDAVPGTVRVGEQGACDHDVLAGTWVDPYTGATLRFTDLKDLSQAQAIQIDHVVPLAEAWVSGARAWSPQRREAYANNLGVLLAVDGPSNESKGADDPAAWRPRKGYQCRYAVRWIAIKHRWQLSVDRPEVVALRQMLDRCR